jgi:ferredoxin
MKAVRNIRLCTKDCLCLYVCPVGATDTETGQIDAEKCTGCGVCVQTCPSHAISLKPDTYPPQQKKDFAVVSALEALALSKVRQEKAALEAAESAGSPVKRQLAGALVKSNRMMAEDLLREAGYMLPQSRNVRRLLESMLENPEADFPREAAEKLLAIIKVNDMEEEKMELKGSKTEKNLAAAFAGESQARNKYTYFASVARKKATSR